MALTDSAIKTAKAKDKPYKLADEKGLHLLVKPSGKYWRLKYRFAGKEKLLALGVYPAVSLKEARTKTDEAKQQLRDGVDPGELRKAIKSAKVEASANSFEAVAMEWLTLQKQKWTEGYWMGVQSKLSDNLFPWIGSRPVAEITAPELLASLRRIESRGAHETAKRTKQLAGQIFRYAIATGRAERDPAQDLSGALAPAQKKHLAAITDPKKVGEFLLLLESYKGTPVVRTAMQLAPLLFCRPGELRHMEWDEIDWQEQRWEIPASKMKMRQPHIVPLCKQAISILQDIQPLTKRSRYVLPGVRSASRPMSNATILRAMRSLGIDQDEMSAHGFRAMARTILDEVLGVRVDWIEHQLAHAVKDANGRAYNRTAHLEGRKEMMQMWADYLDALKAKAKGENVVPVVFNRNAKI